jgi:hypothetical protein
LEALPNELLSKINDNLDLVSCFRLGLVSRRMWTICWPYLQQDITEVMGTWAGARIICLGEYYVPGDWPAGFLTREEESSVNQGLDKAEVDFDPEDNYPIGPGHLFSIARCLFQRINPKANPFFLLLHPLHDEETGYQIHGRVSDLVSGLRMQRSHSSKA